MGQITKEQKRRLLMRNSVGRVAESLKDPLEDRWGSDTYGASSEQRWSAVLDHVRGYLSCLLPEHEDVVRQVLARVPWPDTCPTPSYDQIFREGPCPTCDGTGVAGVISSWRCPTCKGSGRRRTR